MAQPSPAPPGRGRLYDRRINSRYLSRSQVIALLAETDEITQAGGEALLRGLDLSWLRRLMKHNLGYHAVIVIEDDDPYFSEEDLHEELHQEERFQSFWKLLHNKT